ncbi:MAG: sodium:solute symporter family protein [Planctomycetota bacterium]
MQLTTLDWTVMVVYVLFALAVGFIYARKAGQGVEEFFLSGRRLPWWLAGTSLVATTFASDTPLVITGWVREKGIYENWLWWCVCIGSVFTVLLFSRYWQRGRVMTSAELAELRYGGPSAKALRFSLGIFQSGFTNAIILSWVMLAAATIQEVVFDYDKATALVVASLVSLTYCSMAGLWGVVVTDLVQFIMAMTGSIALAWMAWSAVDGMEGVRTAMAAADTSFQPDTLSFFPTPGPGSFFDASFWNPAIVTLAVLLGMQWWARESADGGPLVVQRVSSAKSERDGMLAVLWYNVAHFALRPWPWILVAVASLVVLPRMELTSPVAGTLLAGGKGEVVWHTEGEIIGKDADWIEVQGTDGGLHRFEPQHSGDDWSTLWQKIEVGEEVKVDQVLAKTHEERAYVVMMGRYLPAGLLGLALAALMAAFMSTVDTHVNLASSFFVGDVYRRFLRPGASEKHYVLVARLSGAAVLAIAGVFAWAANSNSELFTFFMAFVAGVGPVYLARWFWWRVRAASEIAAMVTSATIASLITFGDEIVKVEGYGFLDGIINAPLPLGPLVDEMGKPNMAGRLVLVVGISGLAALFATLLSKAPDPATLTEFYRRVRPMGWWGPVRALCPGVEPAERPLPVIVGSLGGSAAIFGLLFASGAWFFERPDQVRVWSLVGVVGTAMLLWGMRALGVRGETES